MKVLFIVAQLFSLVYSNNRFNQKLFNQKLFLVRQSLIKPSGREHGTDYQDATPKNTRNEVFHPSKKLLTSCNWSLAILWDVENFLKISSQTSWRVTSLKSSDMLCKVISEHISELPWSSIFRLLEQQYMAWSKGRTEAYLHIIM